MSTSISPSYPLSAHKLLTFLLCALSLTLSASLAFASGWEQVEKEAGIVVSKRSIKGYDLPQIRGIGTIRANIFDVLAVLDDTSKHSSWMHDCKEASLLKTNSDFDRIVYNRIDTPWPLDDRDAVIRAQIKVNAKRKIITIHFSGVKSPLKKPVDGVVRMPTLKGFYQLKYINETTTQITYQAQADPGGLIPDLVVESGSKDIPLNTIKSLRRQVKKTQGTYSAFLKRWDPRHGGPGFDIEIN